MKITLIFLALHGLWASIPLNEKPQGSFYLFKELLQERKSQNQKIQKLIRRPRSGQLILPIQTPYREPAQQLERPSPQRIYSLLFFFILSMITFSWVSFKKMKRMNSLGKSKKATFPLLCSGKHDL